jgi:hypothetical protein
MMSDGKVEHLASASVEAANRGEAPAQLDDVHPMLFHIGAARYLRAADDLYALEHDGEWIGNVQEPVYLLYAHVIELSIKAFLRGAGLSSTELAGRDLGHNLVALYAKAVECGLSPPADLAPHFEVVIRLTKSSNLDGAQAHRY